MGSRKLDPARFTQESAVDIPQVYPLQHTEHPFVEFRTRFPLGVLNYPPYLSAVPTKGKLYLSAYIAQSDLVTNSFSLFYLSGASGWNNCYIGVYTYSGTLIATSNAIPTPVGGSQILVVPLQATMKKGDWYWVVYQFGLATTAVGSFDGGGQPTTLQPLPATGPMCRQTCLQTSLTTFSSSLPTNLSNFVFANSGNILFVGVK